MTSFHKRFTAWMCVLVLPMFALSAHAEMRITEYMYGGANGEFIEFTNVGIAPVDMTGYSFDDDSEVPHTVALDAFGTVAPGESVILTETDAATFRTAWSLCDAVKVIGGNATNLGRDDEINLFDADGALVDRLKYGDDTLGGPRANAKSAWVSADGLGANDILDWTLSAVADGEGSIASAAGDIGSPGRSTRATVPFDACPVLEGAMRITEYMYSGANGEFVELTNVGNAPLDLAGWSFSDSAEAPGAVDLSAYGTVAAGESVILTETDAATFRTDWNLCSGIKVIGGNTANLGRADEINLYDADDTLVDRLTYGDQTLGGPRTQNASAWPTAGVLGNNDITGWILATQGDAEGSIASLGADVGSPGRSSRASVAFDPCEGGEGAPIITVDPLATSIYLDLAPTGAGTASGVIDDPSDPAATEGIGFTFALPGGGDASALTIAVESSNPAVVDATGLLLRGDGAARNLEIVPHGVGYATITLSATDASNNTGTYVVNYAASQAPAHPDDTRFHTGASDASATIAVNDTWMIVADDETNVLRLYDRNHSGLPVNGFDFSADLALTDPDNPELDLEASTEIDSRVFWTTSFSNSKNFHVRPNRHRVFATDLTRDAENSTLAYVGRYDFLLEDMVAWDDADGHGLGAGYLGFAASSAEGVDSKTPEGFNIEGLAMAPDDATAYFAFRAPLLPTNDRHQAVIVPVEHFADLVTGAAPDSLPQGSATFGPPIFLDLGGRGIRSLDRNAAGQYLITAGPTGDATGISPSDFRLYAWTGQPGDAPFDVGLDMTALDVNDGSLESIAGLPDVLGPATSLQFLFDNGDSIWYADGIAAKDLPNSNWKKATSLRVTVDIAFPAAAIVADAGTPQSATVSQPFATPLRVHVVDAFGHGKPNAAVEFATPLEGASATLSSTSATTDADGYASVTATANTFAGDYEVTATVEGLAAIARFALANVADVASGLGVASGDAQGAMVGTAYADPLVVHVTDAFGNPLEGVEIAFEAPSAGASATLSASSATTNASGDASVSATANGVAGAFVVVATLGEHQATFSLTNLAGPAAIATVTGGTPQSAVVGHAFANPLVVHVTDIEGNAITGAAVTFGAPSNGASAVLSATNVATDANGDASVTATANAIAGSYRIEALVNGVAGSAAFDLTNTIDSAEVIFENGFDPN
ncbi:MAG: DUF3616 domain-containing protein [Rhodanobacteraceae bacterium]